MKPTLAAGLSHSIDLMADPRLCVPALFPDDAHTAGMPNVLATAWLVAAMERCCIHALAPHLDAGEGSLGIGIELEHMAPTPAGMRFSVACRLTAIEKRQLTFEISARDAAEEIGRATHRRAVVVWERFLPRIAAKAAT